MFDFIAQSILATSIIIGSTNSALGDDPSIQHPEPITQFAAFDDSSETRIDFSAWSEFLSGIVYDVGSSDRRPAIGRNQPRTGTRLTFGSSSRYRYEGNRVLYHLIDDEREEALSAYREELITLPDRVPLRSISSNEQLAYWLNLHNVIIIDELMQTYPKRRIDEPWDDDPNSLFNKTVATVEGVPLSLNDIRHRIVGAHWDDWRAIYGFHLGAVGGPSIHRQAFSGPIVWSQLQQSGREFVNALRGVENDLGSIRVSPLFFDHQYLFDSWPYELTGHLENYGDADVDAVIQSAARIGTLRWDSEIADLTNGRRCSAPGAALNVVSYGRDGRTRFPGGCEPLPPQAIDFVREIQLRRIRMFRDGQMGRVTIQDIPTESLPEPGRNRDSDGAGDSQSTQDNE
jgi:hypothetical protein